MHTNSIYKYKIACKPHKRKIQHTNHKTCIMQHIQQTRHQKHGPTKVTTKFYSYCIQDNPNNNTQTQTCTLLQMHIPNSPQLVTKQGTPKIYPQTHHQTHIHINGIPFHTFIPTTPFLLPQIPPSLSHNPALSPPHLHPIPSYPFGRTCYSHSVAL